MAVLEHIGLLLVVGLIGSCCCEQHFHLAPDHYETWSDNVYLNFSYTIDNTVPYMNITHKVLKTIPDLEAHVESYMRSKDNADHFMMTNATFSLCDLLQLKSVHPISALAFATVRRHGVMPEKCPIEPGTYRLTKVWPPAENIPTTMPQVEADFNLQLFAVDKGSRHMILNNKMKVHTILKEGSGGVKGLFGGILKG